MSWPCWPPNGYWRKGKWSSAKGFWGWTFTFSDKPNNHGGTQHLDKPRLNRDGFGPFGSNPLDSLAQLRTMMPLKKLLDRHLPSKKQSTAWTCLNKINQDVLPDSFIGCLILKPFPAQGMTRATWREHLKPAVCEDSWVDFGFGCPMFWGIL